MYENSISQFAETHKNKQFSAVPQNFIHDSLGVQMKSPVTGYFKKGVLMMYFLQILTSSQHIYTHSKHLQIPGFPAWWQSSMYIHSISSTAQGLSTTLQYSTNEHQAASEDH